LKDINKISAVYFLGIGGIGMSALARYFKNRGLKVSGYDRTPTELTAELEEEGIVVHFEDNLDLADKSADIIVYTPAISSDHKELNYFKSNKYDLLKRSDVLGMITKDSFNICIAGTHGKTTTSAMTAHILRHSGFGCNAFLGGIATNYDTNFWSSVNNVSVAEADEYDRSFLKLSPDIAVITSMDPDHLDIYGTEKNMQDAFVEFTGRIKKTGLLISKYGLKRTDDFLCEENITYHLDDKNADARGEMIQIVNGSYLFDVRIKEHVIKGIQLNMGGMHNIENSVACIAVAHRIGIDDERIKAAIAAFAGVKRRFEYVFKSDDHIIIDDYAHHPEELKALINGAKELYPDKKCMIVFQPHLFSRTRDHAKGFGEVLSMADEVILLPIYPAREKPIEGVVSEMILEHIHLNRKKVLSKNELLSEIRTNKPQLLIIAGAGDVDTMVEPVKNIIEDYQ
jgi:UDP-N-acetylmuramate--alanine ligase